MRADMEDGGMGKGEEEERTNGWDGRIMGGRVVGPSGEVEMWKWKRMMGREGQKRTRESGEKEVRSVISWRLSLQHIPGGLYSFSINSGILGLHPRHSYGYIHTHSNTKVPGESHRLTQTYVIRSLYRYAHRIECVDTQETYLSRHA